jgi:Na+/melibiose symporter-like transporter
MVKKAEGLGRSFSNVFVSNLATNLGEGIAQTAAPLLALRLTTDPLLISGIAALSFLPWLLFAIPAGILVDRIDRRIALALANWLRGLLAVALVVFLATDSLTIWDLYVVVFFFGVAETVYDGAIRAVVPSIVVKSKLPAANSRIEAGELVMQRFIAAPFTSLLFAVAVLIPLGVNIGVYVVALVLALMLPKIASGRQYVDTDAEPEGPWYRQYVDGFRFITASRMFRTLWYFSTFIGFSFSAATGGFVLFLVKRDGLPASLYGVFLLTGAIGGILGSLVVSRLKNAWGAGLTMAVMNLVSGLALALIGAVTTVWAAAIGFFLSSVTVIIWNVLVMSLRQSFVPGRLLGRVHGTWRTLLWGVIPIGSIVGGLLGEIDLRLPFILGGAGATVAGILFFRFLMSLPNPEDVDNGDRPMTDAGPAGLVHED